MAAPTPERCVNCGEIIMPDDAGGWIHERTSSHVCALTFYAEPFPKGLP